MTINQILMDLELAKPDAPVHFDFCGCLPTTVQSWRGIYAEPAIGWTPDEYPAKGTTASQLVDRLMEAIDGRTFEGYKGGTFRYRGDSPLHVDNYGHYTNTEIVAVKLECDGDYVVLVTGRDYDE